jgi:DNA-binding response OmpR family regulator
MVIDDDVEIVHYVKTLLTPTYNVVSRFDAESAINCIREKAPDLVLSDVMMQGKDGFELCREIKNDLQLCHIPVVLVTARTTTTDQIKGLGTGADAYVTKPFDPAYLQALISSIMQNRDKVRHILATTTQPDTIEADALSPQDNAFMTELYKIMEQELSNPDLDVSHMTDMLRISRTKLYYKVKGLTGENPSAFFRRYKLNRAAELIKEGHYNMSEIADLTGFSSLSHFSTSFKKQFGIAPSEYK